MRGFNEACRRANASDLRDYFLGDGQIAGLRSIHGPLIDMAQSGFSTGRDPESQVTGRRFSERRKDWRDGVVKWQDRSVAQHRKTHAALFAIDARHRDILCAAYGPQRPWHPQVMRALKQELPEEFRDAAGAALLSRRVQEGMRNREELAEHVEALEGEEPVSEATKRRRKVKAKPGVLVWSPKSEAFKRNGKEQSDIERVAVVTATALRDAHLKYATALGQLGGAPVKKKATRRVASVTPFNAPGGW